MLLEPSFQLTRIRCEQLLPEKMGFVSASTLFQKSKSKTYITTGSKRTAPFCSRSPPVHADVACCPHRARPDPRWRFGDNVCH
ncbi:hypothetical protein PybrP1_010941 [[Pythium] brassicae (nom. inval.)]|nr:hypothetical protein PybrP1_010941 [[Pythium] brassicae (nom. inval.)]